MIPNRRPLQFDCVTKVLGKEEQRRQYPLRHRRLENTAGIRHHDASGENGRSQDRLESDAVRVDPGQPVRTRLLEDVAAVVPHERDFRVALRSFERILTVDQDDACCLT